MRDLHRRHGVVLFKCRLLVVWEVTVMKRILYLLFVLVINVFIFAKPVRADSGSNDSGVQEEKRGKDECLLVAMNCGNDYITLEQKIEKLRKEISKGRAVYTDDELNILREQLNNASRTLEYFRYEGARNGYKYP
jgi:hypothetical protein